MFDLLDYEGDLIIKTDMTRKLTLDGTTKAYPVYKIRLSELYYNDKNDRIATAVDCYNRTNNTNLSANKSEEYNLLVEDFIVKSNEQAIFKTKNNIRIIGQREAGVVLSDGRVIDGNRRFTCLRQLAREGSSDGYFEAVILDKNVDAKQIKLLELMIQHGEEQRVEYDPLDMLVGMYRDIQENHLFSIEEYAKATDINEQTVRDKLKAADVIVEFLEFINMPKHWYIAKEFSIYTAVSGSSNMQSIIRRCDDKFKDDLKNIIFTNITLDTSTKLIEILSKLVSSDMLNSYIKHTKQLCQNFKIQLDATSVTSYSELKSLLCMHSDTKMELVNMLDDSFLKQKVREVHSQPSKNVSKATSMMKSIDKGVIDRLTDKETEELKQNIVKLASYVNQYSEVLDLPVTNTNIIEPVEFDVPVLPPKPSLILSFENIIDVVNVDNNIVSNLLKTIRFETNASSFEFYFVDKDKTRLSSTYRVDTDLTVSVEFDATTSSLSECYMLIKKAGVSDNDISQVIRFIVKMDFVATFGF